jgi:ABC-type nitrate/sulfonate/bicarbonate transport system substrate-binding protein
MFDLEVVQNDQAVHKIHNVTFGNVNLPRKVDRFAGCVTTIIMGVFILAAGLLGGPSVTFSAAPTRIGVPSPSVSYFPVIVASRKGFFAQEGISAEFIVMKPSIISAALSSGEIHFTTATGTAAGAILRGFPFKIVVYFSTRLMDSLVVKPQIKSVADLRGKIIGVDAPGATTHVITTMILRKYQLDPERDAKVLAVGDEDVRLQHLKLGQIDAAMLGPQGVVLARRAGLRTLLDVADEIDLPFVGMATSTQAIERQRANLKKSLTATVRGIRHAADPRNRGEMIALLSSWLRLDAETAEHSYNVFIKGASKDGTLSRSGMEALVNERKRQVKFSGDVALDKVFDFTIVEEVNRELGK